MIETQAPGKLFIAGEYAVVEPAEPAILVAVDRFLRVRLTEIDVPAPPTLSPHVSAAIEAVEELRADRGLVPRTFTIESESELEDEQGVKFGLGSSAAVTVAVVEALNCLYDLGLTLTEQFKLSLLATIAVSPKASGGDIAASTFGGWIRYTSPNRKTLVAHRAKHGISSALNSEAWQGFSIDRLPAPQRLDLLVGWTGSPASTQTLVDQLDLAAPRDEHQTAAESKLFLIESRACVDAITSSLKADTDGTAAAISRARHLLQRLGKKRGVAIETETLRALCDIAESHGFAAKPSGAGGGDCGIVLARSGSDTTAMFNEWEQQGVRQLSLAVHEPLDTAEGEPDEH